MLAVATMIAVIVGLRLYDYDMARREYTRLLDETTEISTVMETSVITQPPAPTDAAPAVIVPDATATSIPSPTQAPFYSEKVRGY